MKALLPFILLAASCVSALPRADAALVHHEQVAPGVHAVGFADRYRSANCGFIDTGEATLLVDLPRGVGAAEFLADVAKVTGKPATGLVLTHAAAQDAPLVSELLGQGIKRVYLSPATYKSLASRPDNPGHAAAPGGFELLTNKTAIGTSQVPIDFLPLDEVSADGGAVVELPGPKVLFGGPLVVHGPRVPLEGTDTAAWAAALRALARFGAAHVVPGFGSWGGPELVERQARFLGELRRQIGYFIANGRPHDDLAGAIQLAADYVVWMPYDNPLAEDLEHVYGELTVPQAPFSRRPPQLDDKTPHALVLIGDGPHEPGHVEAGLREVFEATGVVAHFTVDVRALSAANLARVRLLVILRDGLLRPAAPGRPDYVWMTPEQQQAIVDFVERGGGFLNLHNSLGLYPPDGPYLKLAAGRYVGHGPLERFRVEVVDRDHPVTRGVEDFSVADEQHTPEVDADRIHLLLRNRSDDGKTAAAGWVREPGRGRLCHLANGHTRESLAHPMYQRLMRNAVLWCLRQDAGLTSDTLSPVGRWRNTGPMRVRREYPGGVRLRDGRVLAVSGHPLEGKSIASAELYDPKTGAWNDTGSLQQPRNAGNAATLLHDGRVLLAGGHSNSEVRSGAEIYDPSTGTWSDAGTLSVGRDPAATPLADGRVLVSGGIDWYVGSGKVYALCELYDPATGKWNGTGPLATGRYQHRVELLDDGRVVAIAGYGNEGVLLDSTEVYEPSTGRWQMAARLPEPRAWFSHVKLLDGRILVAGGYTGTSSKRTYLASVVIFDAKTGRWTEARPMSRKRGGFSITLLPDGQVLVAGGVAESGLELKTAELFDPRTQSWRPAAAMNVARRNHRAAVLPDGSVLVIGGGNFYGTGFLASCEIFSY